ncbi:bile acid:sodium symporter family protein [Propionibacterium sp. oral taxon 192]|uniref:bile acid:sodium symporter family protein n=1 Tax=Propionibacterium sp. oral taxon 192 TaxID=671222 RepID=UPI0003A8E8CA|nr:bile acid:sodium symporter family protein [Propionibacterium sp. oral taxon 192]
MASGRHFKVDWFLTAIVVSAVVASFLPARGIGVPVMDWTTKVLIFILFFLYGVRLKPSETLAGLKHWKLHAVILSFTYVIFPILGILLGLMEPWLISGDVHRGFLFLCLVPSTVQSSINFTSIARGNVAGAIVSASVSNLLGVFVTPLLALWLMTTTGLTLDPSSVVDIACQILLPFMLGQFSRRVTADFVARHPQLKLVDQGSIVLVVYKAFSQGAREGLWQRTGIGDLVAIVVITGVLLMLMLWLTWQTPAWLGFNRRDQITIQFCGTKKSLATGVPMASVMFPAASVGTIVLPLVIFHMVQLMVCGALSTRYAAHDEDWHETTNR